MLNVLGHRHTVSFVVLGGAILVLGVLFFQIVQSLVLPIFLAAILALLVYPLQPALTRRLRAPRGIAAGTITLFAVLAIIGPMVAASYLALSELRAAMAELQPAAGRAGLPGLLTEQTNPQLARTIDWLSQTTRSNPQYVRERLLKIGRDLEETLYQRSIRFVGDLPGFVLSVVMFVVALFFFLRDGATLVQAWDELTLLEPEYDATLRLEFTRACRGTVWATVASALVQGVLFGAGFFVINLLAGLQAGSWVLLLSLLTLVCGTVPFLGAIAVWAPAAVDRFAEGDRIAAGTLAIFGTVGLSQVDNLIRIVVLKDSAKLHPLLACVCVFGGIAWLGIAGVFVGPIVGVVLFSLLRILKQELLTQRRKEQPRAVANAAVNG